MTAPRSDRVAASADQAGSGTSASETDHVYATRDGQQLLARIYQPGLSANGGAPVVIDVHGGHWSSGDRLAGHLYDRALAANGFAVVAVDFRQGPGYRHPAASTDVVSAIRWVRESADRFGFDAGRIGLVGSSSGGHLALLAACRLGGSEFRDHEHDLEDPPVSCVAALWSPVDPYRRYCFALDQVELAAPELTDRYRALVAGSLDYFGSEEQMMEASIPRLVADGEALTLPPLWLCRPSEDLNVPRPILDDLVTEWDRAGGHVELTEYEGQSHGFGHRPGPVTDMFVADLVSFYRRHL
jgi:acetyl esterase